MPAVVVVVVIRAALWGPASENPSPKLTFAVGNGAAPRHSTGHVLELREVQRLRPFETALGEHLKHRIDALRVIQAAEHDEDHSWEALQVAGEHPGAALRAEVSV